VTVFLVDSFWYQNGVFKLGTKGVENVMLLIVKDLLWSNPLLLAGTMASHESPLLLADLKGNFRLYPIASKVDGGQTHETSRSY